MNKKRIALVIVLALFFVASGVFLTVTFLNVAKAKEYEATLKAENEKTYISDLFHDQGDIYMSPTEPEEGETVDVVEKFLAEEGYTNITSHYDSFGEGCYMFGLNSFPVTIYVDKDGYLFDAAIGMTNYDDIKAIVDSML